RDGHVTGVQTCALPIWPSRAGSGSRSGEADTASVRSDDRLLPRGRRWYVLEQRRRKALRALVLKRAVMAPLEPNRGDRVARQGRSEERRVGKEGRSLEA